MIRNVVGYADISSESRGFLSSLLGAGCECNGYAIRIVGHSLGGAIASMLGLRVRVLTLHPLASFKILKIYFTNLWLRCWMS